MLLTELTYLHLSPLDRIDLSKKNYHGYDQDYGNYLCNTVINCPVWLARLFVMYYCTCFIVEGLVFGKRPRSIYQYSNMAPRLSSQTSIFGVVFFVSKSHCGTEGQKKKT